MSATDGCPVCGEPLTKTVVTDCVFDGFVTEGNDDFFRLGPGTHIHGLIIKQPAGTE